MKRALLLSGGTALGAVQVYPMEQLVALHGYNAYHKVEGVSVGGLNAAMFAAHRLPQLRRLWEQVDGTRFFMAPNVATLARGIFSLAPLRKKLRQNIQLEDLLIPYACGVVDLQADEEFEYVSVESSTLTDSDELHQAMLASAAQPVIMKWEFCKTPHGEHACVDGGVKHVIPALKDWRKYDAIDVILCSPIGEARKDAVPLSKVDRILEVASRVLSMYSTAVVEADVARLKSWAKAGKEVNLYAPTQWPGKPFDADAETVQWRLDTLGQDVWKNHSRL